MEATGDIGQGSAQPRSARRLTTHQQAVLIQVLLTFPEEPVGVCCLSSAPEARSYADDFLTIFKAINWSAQEVESAHDFPVGSAGLALIVRENQLPASAEALRDALRIYNLEAQVLPDRGNLCGSRKFVLAVA